MRNAIILMGLPLAGKSKWIEDNAEHLFGYSIVSADEIKEKHPDYDPDNAYLLHQYSVKAAEDMVNNYVELNYDIVLDSGSINNSYTKRIINNLKLYDYHVTLVHIKTPYQICIERGKNRERKVPEAEIIKKAVREKAQFHMLSEMVDKVEIVDYFKNKHIFVDMDGVIAALSTLPIINGEIDFVNGEVHRYLEPVAPVIHKLLSMKERGYNLYILSAIPTSFAIEEKNEWLDQHFNIDPKHRFFVNQGRHKAEMLEGLSIKLKLKKNEIMMLDDFHDVLYKIKDRGMNAMHVSEFLIHNFD